MYVLRLLRGRERHAVKYVQGRVEENGSEVAVGNCGGGGAGEGVAPKEGAPGVEMRYPVSSCWGASSGRKERQSRPAQAAPCAVHVMVLNNKAHIGTLHLHKSQVTLTSPHRHRIACCTAAGTARKLGVAVCPLLVVWLSRENPGAHQETKPRGPAL